MSHPAAGEPPPKATEILEYFVRNPQAVDDLEDVARWRLLQERISRDIEEVQRALRWLVSQGFVSEESRVGSAPLFRLNQAQAARAERFVAQHRVPTRGDDAE